MKAANGSSGKKAASNWKSSGPEAEGGEHIDDLINF